MQSDSALAALAPTPFSDEDARVTAHLLAAERHCRANAHETDGATALLRSLLLDELAEYRTDARFPRHHVPGEKTPVFVDAYGTRCAVGHLLEVCGEHELVAHVASTRNLARVRELASEARVVSLLDAVGITVDEAARIQPSYCTTPAVETCNECSWYTNGSTPTTGVADAHVIAIPSVGRLRVSVDAIYGTSPHVAVGSEVEVYLLNGSTSDQTVGTRVVFDVTGYSGVDAGGTATAVSSALAVSSTGDVRCYASAPRVSVADFAAAKLSSDCEGTLAARGGAWNRDTCGDGLRACSTGGAPSASVDVLLAAVPALVALAIARRRARRR